MNMLTKEFTEAVEAKFEGLHKDVQDALKQAKTAEQIAFELAQKMSCGSLGGAAGLGQTWGEQFTQEKAGELEGLVKNRGRVSMEMKTTLTSLTTDAGGSVGDLVIPQRERDVLMMPKRRLTVRNLLDVRSASSSTVEYPEQVGQATNAGMVAEGAAKPESDIQFELKNAPMRVVAHWTKASRQVLEDIPQLRSIIDVELRYGLALKEEQQILSGDNTGQNLHGLIPQATAYAPPIEPENLNKIDVIGLAILQCALTDVPPDGIVMHPGDWWEMRLLKDSTGSYILGNPQAEVRPSLFGLPVVPTEAMTAKKFMVGAYGAQTLYDRWAPSVEVGHVNDDFIKNLVTVLAEERIGLAAKRPEALIFGDFDSALAA